MTNLSLDQLLAPPPADGAPAPVPQRILETIVLRFLARVIHADGVIHAAELTNLVGVAASLQMSGDEARRVLDDELNRKSDCAVLAAQIPDRHRRREVYALGCLMGAADGAVADEERAVLAEFARGAVIPDADAQAILDEVLKVTRGARPA